MIGICIVLPHMCKNIYKLQYVQKLLKISAAINRMNKKVILFNIFLHTFFKFSVPGADIIREGAEVFIVYRNKCLSPFNLFYHWHVKRGVYAPAV